MCYGHGKGVDNENGSKFNSLNDPALVRLASKCDVQDILLEAMKPIFTLPRWSAHEVKDWDKILARTTSGETAVNPVSAAIINYTVIVGVGNITAENVDEVFMRVAVLEAVCGAYFTLDDRPLFITHEDIRMHIGLDTEAPTKTLAEFWGSLPIQAIPTGIGHLQANGGLVALSAFTDPEARSRGLLTGPFS